MTMENESICLHSYIFGGHPADHWTPLPNSGNLNPASFATSDAWSWADFSQVIEYFIEKDLRGVSHFRVREIEKQIREVPKMYHLQSVAEFQAWSEIHFNERMADYLAGRNPFLYAKANPRFLMILCRELIAPIYLEVTRGYSFNPRTLWGLGEYLCPKIRVAIAGEMEEIGWKGEKEDLPPPSPSVFAEKAKSVMDELFC